MNDTWEDCEDENIVIPVPNKEQIKRLEERKKIEELEIALMKDFFDNNNTSNSNETGNKPKISKQKENQLKQKDLSVKLKQKK